jgi:hypothetical protein
MYEYTYHIVERILLVFYDKPTLGHVCELRLLLSIAMTGWCDKNAFQLCHNWGTRGSQTKVHTSILSGIIYNQDVVSF